MQLSMQDAQEEFGPTIPENQTSEERVGPAGDLHPTGIESFRADGDGASQSCARRTAGQRCEQGAH